MPFHNLKQHPRGVFKTEKNQPQQANYHRSSAAQPAHNQQNNSPQVNYQRHQQSRQRVSVGGNHNAQPVHQRGSSIPQVPPVQNPPPNNNFRNVSVSRPQNTQHLNSQPWSQPAIQPRGVWPPSEYTHPPSQTRKIERPRQWAPRDIDALKSKDCQISALKTALAAKEYMENNTEKDCEIAELKDCVETKEKEIVKLKKTNKQLMKELEAKDRELEKFRSSACSFQKIRRRSELVIAERDKKIKELKRKCVKLDLRMKRLQQVKVSSICDWHRQSVSPEDIELLKSFDINAPVSDSDDDYPVYPPRPLHQTAAGLNTTPGFGDPGDEDGSLSGAPIEPRSSRTRLCTFFALSKCYKHDCQFAHGLRELQPFNVKNYKCDDCTRVVGCLGLDCKYRHGEIRTTLRDGFYLVYGGNLDAPRLCYMPEGDERKNAEEKFHANLGKIINRLERLLPKKLLPAQIIMVYRDF